MHYVIWDHDGVSPPPYVIGGGFAQQQFVDEVISGEEEAIRKEVEMRTRVIPLIIPGFYFGDN